MKIPYDAKRLDQNLTSRTLPSPDGFTARERIMEKGTALE